MFRRATGIGLAALAVAGSVVVTGVPAEAAAKCAVGKWRLTSAKLTGKAPLTRIAVKGGGGMTAKIASNGTVNYDFTKSKKLAVTGTTAGRPIKGTAKLSRTLTAKGSVSSGKKGTLNSKTVTGPAKIKVSLTKPTKRVISQSAAPLFKGSATFTCTKTTLQVHKKATLQGVPSVIDFYYRRA